MNRFAVIIPYFGQFKPSIKLFLASCNRNPDVDWFIFTDCAIPEGVQLECNIHWILTTLADVRAMAEQKLGRKVLLTRAYKLCDLKPFYGLIFSDYLSEYEYWAFGDVDVIYGRLTKYLEKIHYSEFDKINWMGHLCLIRNTDRCNRGVFTETEGTVSAETVFNSENNIGFDERDYNLKCIANNMKIYSGKWAADIDIFYWRMRCVDLKTFHLLLDTKEIPWAPRNYKKQIFTVIDGITYRIFLARRRVCFEEFAYIHFRKEVPLPAEDITTDGFIITREGFVAVNFTREEWRNYELTRAMIEKYNNQENPLQELHCFLVHYIRKITGRRKW